jgi:hypothetical protein
VTTRLSNWTYASSSAVSQETWFLGRSTWFS